MNNKICFCTLRDNKGATGGPGGVLFLQKEVLGQCLSGVKCEYRFNTFLGEGKLKSLLNMLLFFFDSLFSRGKYYFTHDITSGFILGLLGKRYSMVYHNQGPLVEEKINLGKKIGMKELSIIKFIERVSFTKANTLHFPSKGAATMYFDSSYASCTHEEVNLYDPLYNIILPSQVTHPFDFELKKDCEKLTFFSLGTLTIAKGQDQSVEFVSEFLKYYTSNVRYIIVGKGPLKEHLVTRLDEMKIQHKNFSYHYYESLPHDTVMYIHSISDIYLMMHRISIFDFATLEAMSESSAVILSKVGGNPEFNYNNNIMFAEDAMQDMRAFAQIDFEDMKHKNKVVFDTYFSKTAFKKQYEVFVRTIINRK